MVEVSWYDATDYADWAAMRLPTEAQWDKAASWEPETRWQGYKVTGRKRKYPWGDAFDETKCNTEESGIRSTTPVGKYSPAGDSPCGAADMAGNVWEWCSSQSQGYPYRADDGRENLTHYASRVLRGGSFGYEASFARCAAHLDFYPGVRSLDHGLRVGWRPLPLNSGASGL